MIKHNSRQKTKDGRMLVKRGDDKFWVVTVTNDHHCTKGLLFYVLINSATFSSCFSVKKKNRIIKFTDNLPLTIWNQEMLAHLNKFSFRQCPNHPTSPPPMTSFRGEICPCRHCRRQCKIFTSGVNFTRNNTFYNINESTKYILPWFYL